MGRNISLKEASNRWIKNSLRAYLDGEKNLRWIAGVLKGTKKTKIELLFNSLKRYAKADRINEFEEWLTKQ